MYPLYHEYHQAQVGRLLAAFAPSALSEHTVAPEMYVAKGKPIFSGHEIENQSYLVTSGEVVILRNEQPVELIEEGEVLDLGLWPGTAVMALSACTLAVMIPMQTVYW